MIKVYTSELIRSNNTDRHRESIELLTFAVTQNFGVCAPLIFGFGKYDKPYILGRPDIHFNISYTGNRVFCAVSDHAVGIDAEMAAEAPLEIAPLYFTRDENEYLHTGDTVQIFYELWTKKESYMKYKGTGFSMSPLSFSSIKVSDALFYYTVWEGVALSICTEKSLDDVL